MPITHAQIEPTTRCNFTCGFCAGRHMRQQDLDWGAFEAFLADHPDLVRVELQGEGEPLLHKRFFDMVEACRARGIAVGLITNGSLLDAAMVERLLADGIDSIHVSMESADPAAFQAIRGGKFVKVRDGIARLMATRRSERPVVGLAVTVLRSTMDALPAILDLYDAEGLDGGIVLQPLQTMGVYSRHYTPEMLADQVPAALMPGFADMRRIARQRAPVRSTKDFFYFDLFARFDARRDTCPWLDHGAYLGAGGRITSCCFMKDDAAAETRPQMLRAVLVEALERGEVPSPCTGCSTAASIALARRARTCA